MLGGDTVRRKKNFEDDKRNITYINMPISSIDEDKIGISQYAEELKSVINKGAQSIAVTSNFGGGKSSLIKFLESKYSSLNTKFCYVNLWSHASDDKSINLHKAFIYQLASQISRRRGNYVSRRLSKNYGMLGITLPSLWSTISSFIMFLFFAIGFACTTLYNEISEYISIAFLTTHHNKIGIASFLFACFLALMLIYKADIVFSSKNSDKSIDEHELMDIYKTYICKFHFRHFVVVIEDLDRSESKDVVTFIKELRRYYIPYKYKQSNCRLINWIKKAFRNFNRITFIVNIKSQTDLDITNDENLYSKAFDYVLNLKDINIDNYDIVLAKLLEERKNEFLSANVPVFDCNTNKAISEFEWLIRGSKVSLREIKTRLNLAISTYLNLCSKFAQEDISLEKCIAAAYIIREFEDEYKKIKEIGFEEIIDLYIEQPNMSSTDVINAIKAKHLDIKIGENFIEDLKTLINNNLIALDYKQYFFNFPQDSYLNSDKENRLINILLYDKNISEADLKTLVKDILVVRNDCIINAFSRLKRLGKFFPDCIFSNELLFKEAFRFDNEMLFDTLFGKFSYDTDSISSTAKIIIKAIDMGLGEKQKYIDKICDKVVMIADPKAIIVFRKLIIQNYNSSIIRYKSLFSTDCPLISNEEIDLIENPLQLCELIDFESKELNGETLKNIHFSVLTKLNLRDEKAFAIVSKLYCDLYDAIGKLHNKEFSQYIIELMQKSFIITEELEKIIINNNKKEDIKDKYIAVVNMVEAYGSLSSNTLDIINNFGICKQISPNLCMKLMQAKHYKSFIVNAVNIDINLIDFEDKNIIKTLNNMDFLDVKDELVSEELLQTIRIHLLKTNIDLTIQEFRNLFMSQYPIISLKELNFFNFSLQALNLIDETQLDEDNTDYIVDFLCKTTRNRNETYEILEFVSKLRDVKIKRAMFLKLNFDNFSYYCMSSVRKNNIISNMEDVFNFETAEDQILFMTKTQCTNSNFEKAIKKLIADKEFDQHNASYAEYVRKSRNINNETISNLTSLGYIYWMPETVLKKLYATQKYSYYVASKTLKNNRFDFERDKLEIVLPAYKHIFLSSETAYIDTKSKMCENFDFVQYMMDNELYIDVEEHTRKLFAHCMQTANSIMDLFANYNNEFIINYLSNSLGFRNRGAAECFLDNIKKNSVVAASKKVYENNHHRLEDGALKGVLTRYYKNAIGEK